MMFRTVLVALVLFAACANHVSARTLLQRSSFATPVFTTYLYSPMASGGLQMVSNLTVLQTGTTVTTLPLNSSSRGQTITLTSGELVTTSTFVNSGCVQASLKTSSDRVAAFLTTYADYLSMYGGDYFSLRGGVVYGNLNLSRAQPGPLQAVTSPSDIVTFVLYSLDRRTTAATVSLAVYPPGAQECQGLAPAPSQPLLGSSSGASSSSSPPLPTLPISRSPPSSGGAAASAPRPSLATSPQAGVAATPAVPGSNLFPIGRRLLATSGQFAISPSSDSGSSLVQTTQVRKLYAPKGIDVYGLVAMTNASCIAYRVRGQPPALTRNGAIDLTTLILTRASLLNWAAQDFSSSLRSLNSFAICRQNQTNSGTCGAYVDGLNASETYFIMAAAGLQSRSSSPTLLEIYYTAQASGSCQSNAVQIDLSGSYYGQDTSSDYSYSDSYSSSYYGDYYSDYSDYYDPYSSSSSSSSSSPFTNTRAPPPPYRSSGGSRGAPPPPYRSGGGSGGSGSGASGIGTDTGSSNRRGNNTSGGRATANATAPVGPLFGLPIIG